MTQQTTTNSSCKDSEIRTSRVSRLVRATSSFDLTSTLAKIAAASLVTASAGLGAYYAWTTGSEHGPILGALFVLFAVGLEIAKPLSVVAAFKSLGSLQLVRGGVLALLAIVTIAYSLSAELTLMAGSRGDVVAERQEAIDNANTKTADAKRARDRYEAASKELTTLPGSRPATVLQAEIDALLLTPGADGCLTVNGRVTREVCPQVAALRVEKGRADRKAELEAIMATPLALNAPTAAHESKTVKDADPGASALSNYLAALGFVLPATLLSDWLALLPVIALEAGSALAGLLVQATNGNPSVRPARPQSKELNGQAETEPMAQVVHPTNTDDAATRERVKAAILDQLNQSGGSVQSSERGLAALIGASRPTVRRAINGLVIAGIVAAEATRNGTMLRLVA